MRIRPANCLRHISFLFHYSCLAHYYVRAVSLSILLYSSDFNLAFSAYIMSLLTFTRTFSPPASSTFRASPLWIPMPETRRTLSRPAREIGRRGRACVWLTALVGLLVWFDDCVSAEFRRGCFQVGFCLFCFRCASFPGRLLGIRLPLVPHTCWVGQVQISPRQLFMNPLSLRKT